MKNQAMNLPGFYAAANSKEWGYRPNFTNMLTEAELFRKQYNIGSAATQKKNIQMLNIDLQKDFCFPQGSLYVGGRSGTGAMDDNARIAEFIYRNSAHIKEISCTFDTHLLFQMFFNTFWLDANGNHPAANQFITTDDILSGKFSPNPMIAWWLCGGNIDFFKKQVIYYTQELARKGKYTLFLWPPHCQLGSEGHALAGVIMEAWYFHGMVRGSQPRPEIKGDNPWTENYSIMAGEVLTAHTGTVIAKKNTKFLDKLLTADAIVIAGQASSHCVKSSIEDILDEIVIQRNAPELAKKVYIMEDCTSAVVIPGVLDFTDDAQAALDKFANAGMNIVKSTTPMDQWPGMVL